MALTIIGSNHTAGLPAATCLILLALLLIIAAIGDLRTRNISNTVCGAIAALAIPFWIFSATDLPHQAAIQLGLWIAVIPVLILLFAYRVMGGGDVKLIAGLLLWLTPPEALTAFIVMALTGGAIGVVILMTSRRGRERPSVPYGVAVAAGGLAIVYGRLAPLFQP